MRQHTGVATFYFNLVSKFLFTERAKRQIDVESSMHRVLLQCKYMADENCHNPNKAYDYDSDDYDNLPVDYQIIRHDKSSTYFSIQSFKLVYRYIFLSRLKQICFVNKYEFQAVAIKRNYKKHAGEFKKCINVCVLKTIEIAEIQSSDDSNSSSRASDKTSEQWFWNNHVTFY